MLSLNQPYLLAGDAAPATRRARPARAKAPRRPAPAASAPTSPIARVAAPGDDESFEAWFAAHRDPASRVPGYEHAMHQRWFAARLLATHSARLAAGSEEVRDAAA
jgi:hypothetical protein